MSGSYLIRLMSINDRVQSCTNIDRREENSLLLEVIENEGLPANAAKVGAYMKAGLEKLADRFDIIGDVRGAGLFLGLEFVKDRKTKEPLAAAATHVVNDLRRRRVLISATGPGANILKIRPPLVFTEEHADIFLDAVSQALASY